MGSQEKTNKTINEMNKIQIPNEAKKIFDIFKDAGYKIWLVGGCCRDLLIDTNIELKDLDFASPTRPDITTKILKDNGYKPYTAGSYFGTIGTIINNIDIQVTTFRKKEHYNKGSRHPEVEFGESIDQDIARRDFRMNSIAADENGNIYDPYNGYKDIINKEISVAGDIKEIMSEDPLRLLRCGRFISKLGFSPSLDLLDAVAELSYLITTISVERWKQEMDKLLLGKNPGDALDFMIYTKLCNYMIPELMNIVDFDQSSQYHHKNVFEHTKQVIEQTPAVLEIRWAALMHDLGKAYTRTYENGIVHFYRHEIVSKILADGIMNRFKFPNKLKKRILDIIENHMHIVQYLPNWSNSAVRRFANKHSDANFGVLDALFSLSMADITSSHPDRVKAGISNVRHLKQRIIDMAKTEELDTRLPTGLGSIIMDEFKILPGPIVGKIMDNIVKTIENGKLLTNQSIDYYIEWIKKRSNK